MQCSSACPARKSVADLISNANATMKMDLKWTEDWMKCLASFLDSEYDRLKRALRAEMVSIWVQDWSPRPPTILLRKSNALELTTRGTLEPEPTTKSDPMRNWWKQGTPHALYDSSSLVELDSYFKELTRAHGARVEQYKIWLKCTGDEVSNDICDTKEAIWGVIKSHVERTVWGLRIDPIEFSLIH
ncbi:unnamed protein product [Rhizoctonia solani]|uniref:Uncharacterized protein n=1 Tax=Rhizoctonia solani TaxID=456999 RepID=A0A8H3AU02_9AGAM|nr:unnamed protein product [Rhizoctonia solani]